MNTVRDDDWKKKKEVTNVYHLAEFSTKYLGKIS